MVNSRGVVVVFDGVDRREETTWKTKVLDGRIKLNGSKEWICLAQDRGKSWALVNEVMKPQVPQTAENFLTGW